jgi:alpha-L-fucosidase 2
MKLKIKLVRFAGFALALNCLAQNPDGSTNLESPAVVKLMGEAKAPDAPLSLWYRAPAEKWTEALPLGNGRLGAMVFGGVNREHLQLNEDTLWAGGPYDPDNTNALAALPEARKLVFDGKYDAAFTLISSKMMAKPVRQMPHETLGDLFLDFPANGTVENYRRDLNLDTAVATVSYTVNGVHLTQRC